MNLITFGYAELIDDELSNIEYPRGVMYSILFIRLVLLFNTSS